MQKKEHKESEPMDKYNKKGAKTAGEDAENENNPAIMMAQKAAYSLYVSIKRFIAFSLFLVLLILSFSIAAGIKFTTRRGIF